MINTTDLRYFLKTAQELHLTKAAKILGISQPALSHSLKRLEEELNNSLFLRRKKGLILTDAGLFLRDQGQRIIEDLDSAANFLLSGKKSEHKTFSMGLHPSVGGYVLPFLYKLEMDIKLNYSFGLSREVTQMVMEGKLDCAIAINPYAHPNLIISSLSEDQFTLWSPKKKGHNTKNLFYDPNLYQSHFILRQMEKKGIRFENTVELTQMDLMARLLYEGAGSAILPAKVVNAQSESAKNVKEHTNEIKPFKDRICFVYSEESKYKDELKKIKIIIAGILN